MTTLEMDRVKGEVEQDMERLRGEVAAAEYSFLGLWKEATEAALICTFGMLVTLALVAGVLTLTMFLFHNPLNFATLRAWLYDATFPGLVMLPPAWGFGLVTAKWRVRRRRLRDARHALRVAEYHARPWSKNGIKLPYPTR